MEINKLQDNGRNAARQLLDKPLRHVFIDMNISEDSFSIMLNSVGNRDIAASAFKLVVASLRKSLLSLCTNVALILKENKDMKSTLNKYRRREILCHNDDDVNLLLERLDVDIIERCSKLSLVDDKAVATAAIELVVSSSRKGFPRLCTNIALILKDNMKFKEYLKVLTGESKLRDFRGSEHNINLECDSNEICANWKEFCFNSVTSIHLKSKENTQLSFTTAEVHSSGLQAFSKHVNVEMTKDGLNSDNTIKENLPFQANKCLSDKKCSQLETIKSESVENIIQDTDDSQGLGKSTQFWKKKFLRQRAELEQLENEIKLLKDRLKTMESKPECDASENIAKIEVRHEFEEDVDGMDQLLERLHEIPVLAPVPLEGCKCSRCEYLLNPIHHANFKDAKMYRLLSSSKPLLQIGDIVLIPGNRVGQVLYVGHLDEPGLSDAVFVGLVLKTSDGVCDGVHRDRRYFTCDKRFGLFLPINWIELVIKRATRLL